jgi:hypothetical protein
LPFILLQLQIQSDQPTICTQLVVLFMTNVYNELKTRGLEILWETFLKIGNDMLQTISDCHSGTMLCGSCLWDPHYLKFAPT